MAELSQKLGAKPGTEVVVLFTTRRDELERRFSALKATLAPADGLWVAWPKKAARKESLLSETLIREMANESGILIVAAVCWRGTAHDSPTPNSRSIPPSPNLPTT